MKADKTYVTGGVIYLPGAEMPKGWTPPPEPKKAGIGTVVMGPAGPVEVRPETFTAPNVKPGVSVGMDYAEMGIEDLTRLATEAGLPLPKNPKKEELVALLTKE